MPKYSKYNPTDDISIGKDLWIKFRNINEGRESAVHIDPFMDELADFWKSIETNCEAKCCGIDAFCFWPEEILKNTENLNYENAVSELKNLRQKIMEFESKVVVSDSLNNYFNKITFVELLDHIIDVLENKCET
ncbi:hypothetical protein SAMN02744133_104255 [Thalassospira xiamenensis M-5 = DSM 17429]|uniref:Uncharacterized protein n=1 Tax=Thalassospira xiamenensis M-5 = DSM 17429 TaxID=1123366 RepID=A0AB72UBM8_9PROT|nr:DUF6331 family protein [Thalassospira xiamenensis]AJD51710.1 hypothetical protein TH3_07950 [Thalassospira xiamenensis M-5 = DSM 17429]SIT02061.1 hypothetical protein SAMN02744133_104255 [Thalassospira xiamenensis M-5 = DSM 17429]